ncbi:MAG: alpha/beta fold hydrolase [Solirubrobacteraceae bacterium]
MPTQTSDRGDLCTAQIPGAELAYREAGEGEPVILVHGTGSDIRCWEAQVPVLSGGHRVIAYSRRYAPPNVDIPAGADDRMHPHVDDLLAFMDAIDAAPAHLVGHSWGAFIALLAALRRPDRVRSLVLAEPPVVSLFLSNPPRPGEVARVLARRPRTGLALLRFAGGTLAPVQKALRRGDDEGAMQRFVDGVIGPAGLARLPEGRLEQARDNVATFRAQMLGAGFPPLSEDDVRSVRAPTLLLTGRDSPAFLLRLSDAPERLLPDARRAEVPAASHAMQEENPGAFNAAVVEFLGRGRGRSGG